jgi:trigger factor
MKTTVEKPEPTKVKLTIEVPAGELAPLWAETLKRLSNEVKVPGFRQGKVPKTILESRIGKEQIRQEVLKDALPNLYTKATEQESIGPVDRPEIEVTQFGEGQDLTFTATVEVRADVDLPDYKGIEVTAPSGKATDEDVNNRLERLRERFGTLESVGRPATKGDFVTIDMFGSLHGENLEGASIQDFSYEVGSGMFGAEMDEELIGKRPGDIVQLNAEMPEYFRVRGHEAEELTWRVVVKDVQAKTLPSLDDEFAKVASEFDTLEELRAEIARTITRHKSKEADLAVRNLILMHMLDHTEVPLPSSLVNREAELRLARLLNEVERSGSTFEEYLRKSKIDKEELFDNYRQTSEVTVKADLILEAVAKAEGMEVLPEDFDKEMQTLSEESGSEPEKLREALLRPGAVNALAGDILRRKALDFLVEHARITEESAESTTLTKG